MKVRMLPTLAQMGGESGIKRVVEAYYKYLPEFGVELVDRTATSYDITASHAGMLDGNCDVAHLHGIYFTADYLASAEEWTTNKYVIQSALTAKMVTVPTRWVAKTFQRDMRINPIVLPHGIEAEQWRHSFGDEGYVLWNKNRFSDVCNPDAVGRLAQLEPGIRFASTFAPSGIQSSNLKIMGVMQHDLMKEVVQRASVYLSTTKETFGIGVLEALASGVPVLGWDFGGNQDLVEHGVTGYLAQPGNFNDLRYGLNYCLTHRKQLSNNAVIAAQAWSWMGVIEKLYDIYKCAAVKEAVDVAVVIPCYNKPQVERAIKSVKAQTLQPAEIILADDCSDNGDELTKLARQYKLTYVKTAHNSGVAITRNLGISQTHSKYVCCLDADDEIESTFLATCVNHLESNPAVGIAYTKLKWVKDDGGTGISEWPPSTPDFQRQMEKGNQVPTCNVFRRKLYDMLGGYRQRYAPYGAGEEDGELWLRIGSIGYSYAMATEEPLFIYHMGDNSVHNNRDHQTTDWTAWHPWVTDKRHPFASIAATANGRSHPVRQYDEPVVSVIIPVAPHHLPYLADALDSLEAQTYRLWEAILVIDGKPFDDGLYRRLLKAYPYLTLVENLETSKGAGWARNEGAKVAKGKFLVFLDADDYLAPQFLDLTLKGWSNHKGVMYTDYVDRALWNKADYDAQPSARKVFFNTKTGEAFVRRFAKDYDREQAITQPEYNANDPNSPFYIWCISTVLLPKLWFDEIGGYDLALDTWEDVDLHWRLARSGKPFFRVPEPLVTYRFYSGSRRESGMVKDEASAKLFKARLEYIKTKYLEIPIMPCSGCGGGNSTASLLATQTFAKMFASEAKGAMTTMDDEEFLVVLYDHPNVGMHPVVGPATGIAYGYRSGGEQFLVNKKDIASKPDIFKPILAEKTVVSDQLLNAEIAELPVPPVKKVADFTGMTISKETEAKLIAAEIMSAKDIVAAGKGGLEAAGIPSKVAAMILKSANKRA